MRVSTKSAAWGRTFSRRSCRDLPLYQLSYPGLRPARSEEPQQRSFVCFLFHSEKVGHLALRPEKPDDLLGTELSACAGRGVGGWGKRGEVLGSRVI